MSVPARHVRKILNKIKTCCLVIVNIGANCHLSIGINYLEGDCMVRGQSRAWGQTLKGLWSLVLIWPILSCPQQGHGKRYILKTQSSLALEVELISWHSQTPQDILLCSLADSNAWNTTIHIPCTVAYYTKASHSCPSVFLKKFFLIILPQRVML